MPRKSKGPWWWERRGQWVIDIKGKRHYLGTDRDAAETQWHAIMAAPPEETPRVENGSLAWVLDEFLDWAKRHRPASFDWYLQRVGEFAQTVPDLTVAALKPHHVQKWIDNKKSDGHRRGCLVAVNRALNWAVKQGHIDKNPIKGMEKPPAGRREVVIEQEAYEKILATASDQQFRDLLTFCWEVGCRPQEVVRLEARHVDSANQRCVFPEEEAKGKKRKRIIYLTDAAAVIVKRLSGEHPTGPLFRNADGEKWHRNNVACRFARMREKVGRKYTLYHLRHAYCQRALKNGVDPITLAELMGHADATMIMKIYQHIHQDSSHLAAAAKKAAK